MFVPYPLSILQKPKKLVCQRCFAWCQACRDVSLAKIQTKTLIPDDPFQKSSRRIHEEAGADYFKTYTSLSDITAKLPISYCSSHKSLDSSKTRHRSQTALFFFVACYPKCSSSWRPFISHNTHNITKTQQDKVPRGTIAHCSSTQIQATNSSI